MTTDIWTIKAALDWTVGYLESKHDANPRLSAEWLMSEATGLSRIELYVNYEKPLSMDERDVLRGYVARRAAGEPLQLISGTAPFRYLTLKVAPGVLIPRPETEVLVSEALAELHLPRIADHVQVGEEGEEIISAQLPSLRVLDVCTGSGCIACAIASEYPAAKVLALDIADEALRLAKENVEILELEDRVEVRKSNLLQSLSEEEQGSFDLLISNPPYIPTAVLQGLDREVTDFEPRLALDGGEDGLDLVRILIKESLNVLKPNGVLALELFEGHLDEAALLANETGFMEVRIVRDLANRPRVLIAHAPEKGF
ncbi:release factor glutamine methyltransferase [Cryptobacterium sp. CAG:338]|nr:release factor glutamine methyltransferase [Cryptobacterium sp. CAG:338]